MIPFVGSDVVVHPAYKAGTPVNDIALVRLKSPSKFGTVPVAAATSFVGAAGAVAGYGYTGVLSPTGAPLSTGFPSQLQAAPIPIVANGPCGQLWGALFNPQQHICAGTWTGMADSCVGDSGGPLALLSPAGTPAEVAGIVSFGNGCSQYGAYAVYTRLSAFTAWIASVAPSMVSTNTAVAVNPAAGATVCTHALVSEKTPMAALNCGANTITSIQLAAYSTLATPCGSPGSGAVAPTLQVLQRSVRADCAKASAGVPAAVTCVGQAFCQLQVPGSACPSAPAFVVVATCASKVATLTV